jgi:hypothetical protein
LPSPQPSPTGEGASRSIVGCVTAIARAYQLITKNYMQLIALGKSAIYVGAKYNTDLDIICKIMSTVNYQLFKHLIIALVLLVRELKLRLGLPK